MSRNLHPNNLRFARAPHIADRCAGKIVELQFRHASRFARLDPYVAKSLDWLAVAMEHRRSIVRFRQRPLQPSPHVAVEDRNRLAAESKSAPGGPLYDCNLLILLVRMRTSRMSRSLLFSNFVSARSCGSSAHNRTLGQTGKTRAASSSRPESWRRRHGRCRPVFLLERRSLARQFGDALGRIRRNQRENVQVRRFSGILIIRR